MVDYYKKSAKFQRLRENIFYPKALFVFCALIGAIFIWIIKGFSPGSIGAYLSVGVAVGLMFLYCGLSSRVKAFSLREDVIGDNVYYLGFLFTLASLAHALWIFQVSDSATGAVSTGTQHIIQSFGVALWSTIFGITLRVYYAQHRQDPDEFERDARSKLAQTATELNVQLHSCIFEFSKFRTSLQQSVQEAFDDSSKTYNETLLANLKNLTSTSEEAIKLIQTAFSEFTDNGKKINELSTKTVKALENFNQRLEKLETPDTAINRKFASFVSDLETTGAKFANIMEGHVKSANDVAAHTESLTKKLETATGSIMTIQQNSAYVAGSAKNFENLTVSLDQLVGSFAKLKQGITDIVSTQGALTKTATSHSNELEAQLARARQYSQEVHESLVSLVRTAADSVK